MSVYTEVQPEFLPQFQQLNSATIQGVMAPGVTLGQALTYLKTEAKKPGFGINYASESRQYIQQGHAIIISFALSVVLVYLLPAMQFESFRDPLIVLVTLPMAITGALVFLYLGAATINIYTEVGLITLIGLITKQGILIVQFANVIQETEGLDRHAAVEKASSIRLRPILMTTGAMVFGALPLVFATGPGAVVRRASVECAGRQLFPQQLAQHVRQDAAMPVVGRFDGGVDVNDDVEFPDEPRWAHRADVQRVRGCLGASESLDVEDFLAGETQRSRVFAGAEP